MSPSAAFSNRDLVTVTSAAVLYLALRTSILPIPPTHLEQVSARAWMRALVNLPRILTDYEALQLRFFKLNLLLIWVALTGWRFAKGRLDGAAKQELATLAVMLGTLLFVALATWNTAPDRVMMILAPVVALSVVRQIADNASR